MKKSLALVLVLALAVVSLAGCTGGAPATPTATKVGLGNITSIAKSKDYSVDATGKETLASAQVDTVMAAVAFDKDGKVFSVKIDTAQTKVNFDKAMKVTSDKAAHIKSKVELGDEYAMKAVSTIGKNWFEQIAELEKWMVGKTVDEIKALKVKQRDASHVAVPDVPELTSLVTITVEEYLEAVEEAWEEAKDVQGAVKVGLGVETSIAKSKDYSVDAAGKETLPAAQVDTVMTATAFDKDGKVVGVVIDTAQTKVNYDKDGKVTSDKAAHVPSKVELGDAYAMKAVSTIGKNWFEQIAELEKWMVGKTVDEIKALKVKQRDASHVAVPDVPELTSLVTITVEEYLEVVEKAYNTAK